MCNGSRGQLSVDSLLGSSFVLWTVVHEPFWLGSSFCAKYTSTLFLMVLLCLGCLCGQCHIRGSLENLQKILHSKKGSLGKTYKKKTEANAEVHDLNQKTMKGLGTLSLLYSAFEKARKNLGEVDQLFDKVCDDVGNHDWGQVGPAFRGNRGRTQEARASEYPRTCVRRHPSRRL